MTPMNTNDTPERLSPAAGSVTAEQIVKDLLANPYPHDLMAIRRKIEREYGHGCGVDEDMAREEMDTYCTENFMLEARAKWKAAQDAAREWLSSQNNQDQAQPENQPSKS